MERVVVPYRSQIVGCRPSRDVRPAIVGSTTWGALFAGLHLFWSPGDTTGLASSAGRDLALRRPTGFVVFGLYGFAILLIAAIALLIVTAGYGGSSARSRRTSAVVELAGALLLLRGVALEVVLGLDVGGLRATVGPLETRRSAVPLDHSSGHSSETPGLPLADPSVRG